MNDVNRDMRPPGTVKVTDAGLNVWEEPGGHGLPKGYKKRFREQVLHALIRVMRRSGWYVHQDPHIVKHYRCLRQDRRRCWYPGGLQCKLELSGRSLKIQFYQNRTPPDNSAGGYYDFNKMERMPYLLRLRTKFEMNRVLTWLVSSFLYEVKPAQRPCDAFNLTADEWMDQHDAARFHDNPIPEYNSKCQDGIVRNGDRVFFLGGYVEQRWGVGIARHHINNMWWIKVGEYEVRNVASFHLSHAVPEEGLRGRKILEGHRKEHLKKRMLEAAAAQRYLDAERMRVALEREGYVPRRR
jgi:hypothetical protein